MFRDHNWLNGQASNSKRYLKTKNYYHWRIKELTKDHIHLTFDDSEMVLIIQYSNVSRRMICKEYGVPINGAWMTSYGTQKAATRDGWETVAEIHYEEFGKQHNVIYEKDPPSCKFMIARIAC